MKKLLILTIKVFMVATFFSGCLNNGSKDKNLEMKTNTGLRYEIVKVGDAFSSPPNQGDFVTVHYEGWLYEDGKKGKMFDSSRKRGRPFKFKLGGQVIKGWNEGVASMKIGEIRKLIIPSHLGYGSRGAGRDIPPNATLLFEVELLAKS